MKKDAVMKELLHKAEMKRVVAEYERLCERMYDLMDINEKLLSSKGKEEEEEEE